MHKFIVAGLLSLLPVLHGCSSSQGQVVTPSAITAPSAFDDENRRTWRLVTEVGRDDDAVLGRFFNRHPEYAGSPSMSGTPTLFSSSGDRRFYWLQGNGESATWMCLKFEQKQFRIEEGIGNPYVANP